MGSGALDRAARHGRAGALAVRRDARRGRGGSGHARPSFGMGGRRVGGRLARRGCLERPRRDRGPCGTAHLTLPAARHPRHAPSLSSAGRAPRPPCDGGRTVATASSALGRASVDVGAPCRKLNEKGAKELTGGVLGHKVARSGLKWSTGSTAASEERRERGRGQEQSRWRYSLAGTSIRSTPREGSSFPPSSAPTSNEGDT